MDFRLRILVGVVLLGGLVLAGYAVWFFWATCARCQFGGTATRPEHVSEINNLAFRYPDGMEVIVPKNDIEVPVSLVKKGERGETALIQVGTWRRDPLFEGLGEAVSTYERRSRAERTERSREVLKVEGRTGVLFVQDETSGRRILEALIWDPATTTPLADPTLAPSGEVRELSLQLAKHVPYDERMLSEHVFRELLASLRFIVEDDPNRSRDLPDAWHNFENAEGGYELWYPAGWVRGAAAPPPWLSSPDGNGAAFRPSAESEDGTVYTVWALPFERLQTVETMDERFAKLFRETAVAGTLQEDRVGMPGVGLAISLEAHQRVGEKDVLTHFLLIVSMPINERGEAEDQDRAGRGYVIAAQFPEEKTRDIRLDQTRSMTRTLRVR